jgi:hypothetical protein
MEALALVLALFFTQPTTPPTPDGPQCTPVYPRGVTIEKGTKKRPLKICKDGDLQVTWRSCVQRYSL